MNEPQSIEVVAGLLFNRGHLLACQRQAHGPFPLKWEFPGGKMEPGEDSRGALVRELREELGIECAEADEVFTHTHTYTGFSTVKLRFFHVPRYAGPIVNRVFEHIRWVTGAELVEMDFLEGDRPVVDWLVRGQGRTLWHSVEL